MSDASDFFQTAGGAAGLIMPSYTELITGEITFKYGFNVVTQSNSANWITQLGTASSLGTGFSIAQLTTVSNTNEQTVVDISGAEGILTHVVGPGLTGAGIVTIRVTIDGNLSVFTSETVNTNAKYCIGDFRRWAGVATNNYAVGEGSFHDVGYLNIGAPQQGLMTVPIEAIQNRIGMVFKDSLKVTVQGSVNLSTANGSKEASAHYLNYIPKGV